MSAFRQSSGILCTRLVRAFGVALATPLASLLLFMRLCNYPARLDGKGDGDKNRGDYGESYERFREKLQRLALLPFQVHENRLEKEGIAHEGDREYEHAQHGHRREDGVWLLSDEGGAIGDEEDDEDDIKPCKKRIEIRIPSHALIIPGSTTISVISRNPGDIFLPSFSNCSLLQNTAIV